MDTKLIILSLFGALMLFALIKSILPNYIVITERYVGQIFMAMKVAKEKTVFIRTESVGQKDPPIKYILPHSSDFSFKEGKTYELIKTKDSKLHFNEVAVMLEG